MPASRAIVNKVPPYSVHSEKVVIGSILRNPSLIRDIQGVIPDAAAFFRPEHGRVYAAVMNMARAKSPLTTESLIAALAVNSSDRSASTVQQLQEFAAAGEPSTGALVHAGNVAEKARMRQLIDVLADILNDAYHSSDGCDAVLKRAKARLLELSRNEAETSATSTRRRKPKTAAQ